MRSSPAFLQSTQQKLRFRIAILISAIIHGAALLWLRIELPVAAKPISIPTIEIYLIADPPDEEATIVEEVAIDKEPEPEIATPTPAPVISQSSQDIEQPKPTRPPQPIDWENIVSTYAEDATIQNLENERHRDAMWRKTFSVMFTPPEDWLIEDKPYLPDLQFEADKPKRLGIQISENCYLGFPGIDPETVDTDARGWSGGGSPQPTVNLITCGFGD